MMKGISGNFLSMTLLCASRRLHRLITAHRGHLVSDDFRFPERHSLGKKVTTSAHRGAVNCAEAVSHFACLSVLQT